MAVKGLTSAYPSMVNPMTQGGTSSLNIPNTSMQQAEVTRRLAAPHAKRNASGLMNLYPSGPQVTPNDVSSAPLGQGSNASPRPLPPDLEGRYMRLAQPRIQMPKVNESGSSPLPRESMPEADFTPGDATAHQNAAFSRLKDSSGQLGAGAVSSLASTLAGRGIGGHSGTFGRGLADIVSQTVQPLADLNVAHLGEEYSAAQRARELSEGRASNVFSGNIAQRGQDISTQSALNQLRAALAQAQYQGEIAQRGQDLSSIYRLL
jgi:hypothetical protein